MLLLSCVKPASETGVQGGCQAILIIDHPYLLGVPCPVHCLEFWEANPCVPGPHSKLQMCGVISNRWEDSREAHECQGGMQRLLCPVELQPRPTNDHYWLGPQMSAHLEKPHLSLELKKDGIFLGPLDISQPKSFWDSVQVRVASTPG